MNKKEQEEKDNILMRRLTDEQVGSHIAEINTSTYDSTKDTQEHISKVYHYLQDASIEIRRRAVVHDASKLLPPEKEYFDKYTHLLAGAKYGSKEYADAARAVKPALDHHYANNSHHPQYYGEKGISGMNLFDLIEMFFDWKASGERGPEGNIYKSIAINKDRKAFNMSEQIVEIFFNTAKYLGYEEPKPE